MKCIICPTDTIESSEMNECITPERTSTSSPTIDKSTPLSELFKKKNGGNKNIVNEEARDLSLRAQALRASMDVPKQGFYQCNWDVLDVGAESESESEQPVDVNNPYDQFGSATGSALRTDESAKSRSQHHDAQWQGLMTKPVERHGWPTRR